MSTTPERTDSIQTGRTDPHRQSRSLRPAIATLATTALILLSACTAPADDPSAELPPAGESGPDGNTAADVDGDSAAGVDGSAATDAESNTATNPVATGQRPNILLIVADDLGFGDLGVFGSEIPTPNIDRLAGQGMLLTNFYTGLACSPTRAMLMSGVDNHLAGVGVQGSPTREEHIGVPGYVGYLNFEVASLASLMTEAGYDTYMTGKWHLGPEVESGPRARGFKRSFVSLDGAAHLGPWDWRGPQPARYRDGDDIVNVDDSFYSTRFYTERMIDYIEQDRGANRPFFAYLAYTAPHWPLQAPTESIAKFYGDYDDGYEALYAARLARQRALGFVDPDVPAIDDTRFEPRWDSLSDEERAFAARRMEIYAAMVSDLDRYIGQVIDYLQAIDKYDNTLIFFMSDNGAESNRLDLGRNIQQHVGTAYDHSLDNLGSATSYVMYGRNWASASATPFHRHKATAFEGGIHVPAFASFPDLIEEGTRSAAIATVIDLLPTFLDIAEFVHPGDTWRGRPVLRPQGRSMRPMLFGETATVHEPGTEFGWELYSHRSIRRDQWKVVWDRALPEAERRWQLFDLDSDPFEQIDLSAAEPERFREMVEGWDRYVERNRVID